MKKHVFLSFCALGLLVSVPYAQAEYVSSYAKKEAARAAAEEEAQSAEDELRTLKAIKGKPVRSLSESERDILWRSLSDEAKQKIMERRRAMKMKEALKEAESEKQALMGDVEVKAALMRWQQLNASEKQAALAQMQANKDTLSATELKQMRAIMLQAQIDSGVVSGDE